MQNIVILAGNIGQTPEVRTTQGGTKITNFSLATSRPRLSEGRVLRDENGYRVMDTEWHRITCFNGLGKPVAAHGEKHTYLVMAPMDFGGVQTRGRLVMAQGQLKTAGGFRDLRQGSVRFRGGRQATTPLQHLYGLPDPSFTQEPGRRQVAQHGCRGIQQGRTAENFADAGPVL